MQLVAYGAHHSPMSTSTNYYKPKPQENLIFRRIDHEDKNIECPISYEVIKYGNKYYKCKCCKYNFDDNSIQLINNKDTCPMCKTNMWYDNKIYINMSKKAKKKINLLIKILNIII